MFIYFADSFILIVFSLTLPVDLFHCFHGLRVFLLVIICSSVFIVFSILLLARISVRLFVSSFLSSSGVHNMLHLLNSFLCSC